METGQHAFEEQAPTIIEVQDDLVSLSTEKPAEEAKPGEEAKPAEESKSENQNGKQNNQEVNDDLFVLDSPVQKPDPIDLTPFAKHLGFDIENPTVESIEAKIEEKLLNGKYAHFKEFDDSVEGKAIVEFIKNGGTREAYFNVTSNFNQVLSLTDSELVEGFLKETDPEKGEEQFKALSPEDLKSKAEQLRDAVKANREKAILNLTEESKAKFEAFKEKVKEEARMNDSKVIESLRKIEKIMDLPVNQSIRQEIEKMWLNGDYKKRFAEDPDFVAEVLTTHLLAKNTLKNFAAKIAEANNSGKEEVKKVLTKYLFNIPPKKDENQPAGGQVPKSEIPFQNIKDADLANPIEIIYKND